MSFCCVMHASHTSEETSCGGYSDIRDGPSGVLCSVSSCYSFEVQSSARGVWMELWQPCHFAVCCTLLTQVKKLAVVDTVTFMTARQVFCAL